MEEQTKFPLYKSRPIKPFLSTHLITSTPYSHQLSKRIKGLLAYSEHYKGNRVDYGNIGPRFSPLRTRDYRKARELTLEIWDPVIQISFLKKFLKSQENLQTIQIKVLTKRCYKAEILKWLCEILSQMSRLNRVHIDFSNWQKQIMPEITKKIRSLRILPKLKELEATVEGKQVLPFSAILAKVGFHVENGELMVKDAKRLIQKTAKFDQLDTIRIARKNFLAFPDELWEGLALIISKLPNFRELDLNYSNDFYLPHKQTFSILDILMKASKFEIFRIGVYIIQRAQISLLEHPIFQAKSLKRTHLALDLYDSEITIRDINKIWDLLQTMPSLYQLSMKFKYCRNLSDEIIEDFVRKVTAITSIRKLKIVFDVTESKVGAKQFGNMVRSIFNMQFLEELDLYLPENCLDLGSNNGRDIQGLPRLQRASIEMSNWEVERENDIKGIVEILGKCHHLRELELSMLECVYDYQGMTRKLCENLIKLKRLQMLKLKIFSGIPKKEVDFNEKFARTFGGMRCLQDLTFDQFLMDYDLRFRRQFEMNKKYRCLNLNF